MCYKTYRQKAYADKEKFAPWERREISYCDTDIVHVLIQSFRLVLSVERALEKALC